VTRCKRAFRRTDGGGGEARLIGEDQRDHPARDQDRKLRAGHRRPRPVEAGLQSAQKHQNAQRRDRSGYGVAQARQTRRGDGGGLAAAQRVGAGQSQNRRGQPGQNSQGQRVCRGLDQVARDRRVQGAIAQTRQRNDQANEDRAQAGQYGQCGPRWTETHAPGRTASARGAGLAGALALAALKREQDKGDHHKDQRQARGVGDGAFPRPGADQAHRQCGRAQMHHSAVVGEAFHHHQRQPGGDGGTGHGNGGADKRLARLGAQRAGGFISVSGLTGEGLARQKVDIGVERKPEDQPRADGPRTVGSQSAGPPGWVRSYQA
jgi:hypothetical protein